jgi:signal transduction histidine kinase
VSDQSAVRQGEHRAGAAVGDPLASAMNTLAGLAASAAGHGAACLISWQRLANGGAAYAPADSRWEPALWAILGLLWRQGGADGNAPDLSLHKNPAITKPIALRMSAAEVALRCGRALPVQTRMEALGVACSSSPTALASVILLVPQGVPASQSDALIELVERQALAELALSEEAASLWFWRDRAATAAEQLAAERAAARRERDAQSRAERAITAALKLKPRERWSGIGKLFAASGPFAAWAVAVADQGAAAPRIVATSSTKLAAALKPDARSALGEAIRRRATIVRALAERGAADKILRARARSRGKPAAARGAFAEDRVFDGFAAYLCVPFEGGAIALSATRPLEPAARGRAEALAARLSALTAGWVAEERLAETRALVRELGARLFTTADAERARIARDLHDDQAQLLAAARLALEGGRDEARAIFEQLQNGLRARLRELRPAALGDRKLADALRAELTRVAEAGVETQLAGANVADRLPASAQQICFQVAREALANVARHAHATRVEIRIERADGIARLTVGDDGRGIEPGAADEGGGGLGLAGLAERLEYVGGRIKLESRKGMTRLVAEIPI